MWPARLVRAVFGAIIVVVLALPVARAAPPAGQPAGDAVSRHSLALPGGALPYAATAGTLPVRDGKGETVAEIFYTAYVRESRTPADGTKPEGAETAPVAGQEGRPVTFAFNGGPGAASAYLHLGALGPRRLAFPGDGAMPAPPYALTDNAATWLAFTDLVFVDPVGTGWSRTTGTGDDAAKRFWGVRQDIDALAPFVRLWLARNGRTRSPVFLAGESYGGLRAVLLADRLVGEQGIATSGLVLISPALEFSLIRDDRMALLPWAARLPSIAATTLLARGAAPETLPGLLAPVERFARTEYLAGLAAGDGGDGTAAFHARVAEVTGLPLDLVTRTRARLGADLVVKSLEREQGRRLSRYDTTVAVADPYPEQTGARGPDPMLEGSVAPLASAFTTYARAELGYRSDFAYRVLNSEVGRHWEWRGNSSPWNPGVGVSDELRELLSLNPRLRVMVAHGYTDLVTPYTASRYILDQLPAALRGGRAAVTLHLGGHMFYTRDAPRMRLAEEARDLYAAALGGSVDDPRP